MKRRRGNGLDDAGIALLFQEREAVVVGIGEGLENVGFGFSALFSECGRGGFAVQQLYKQLHVDERGVHHLGAKVALGPEWSCTRICLQACGVCNGHIITVFWCCQSFMRSLSY